MIRTWTWSLVAMLALSTACAPIESVRIQGEVVNSRIVLEPTGQSAVVHAAVKTNMDGGTIVVHAQETCTQHEAEFYRRIQFTDRRVDKTTTTVLYALGVLSAGFGTAIVLDAPHVPEPQDPKATNPVGRPGAYSIGGSLLAIGGAILATAVGTSLRAHDDVTDLGTAWRARNKPTTIFACNSKPVPRAALKLTTASGTAPLGSTTVDGRLTFTWNDLESVLDVDNPPTSGTIDSVDSGVIGNIDLMPGRAFWAGRALAKATRLAGADKPDEATNEMNRAKVLGADVTDLEVAIAKAPAAVARARAEGQKEQADRLAEHEEIDDHMARARAFIRRNRPDEAEAELAEAELLGANVESLSSKVAGIRADRTVRQWKSHAAQCKKLAGVRAKLSAVNRCDDECQKIRKMVSQEWEILSSERLDLSNVSEERRESLRYMCEQAGCPECPQ